MAEHSFYHDGHCTVTATALKTPRRTLRLTGVEQTRVHRPGLVLGLALLGACWGLAWVFQPILYAEELAVLVLGPLALLPLAARLGVLTLEYRNLGGQGRVYGRYGRLAQVRLVIDIVLEREVGHD
ncbi:MAG: hypothetical protein AAGI34_18495 [Pseudomonadota bacterium]